MTHSKTFEKAKKSYNSLSPREKNLILITAAFGIIILCYAFIGYTISYHKKISASVINKRTELQDVASAVQTYKALRAKLENLTTKYLNSSLSFEQLTTHLDSSVKKAIQSENFDLISSKDKIELGDEFIANKFNIKIKQCTYQQVLALLEILEVGPPSIFIQKLDISKSSDGKSVSAYIEVVSVQKRN